ncbi:MAG: dienelactone hydrolase family protein [Anaerolineae bacterium]|nr:dienelactone hydrolase family protein [Anaerolineae bacterium]
MPDAKHLQHLITSGFIQVVVEGRSLPAYWAHPQVGGPFPGLVLLHDDQGMAPYMRTLVHRFAQVGYYVAAPDLFDAQRPASRFEAHALEQQFMEAGQSKVHATLQAIRSHHKSNGKMALMGWDFGGTLVYDMAVQSGLPVMAAVSFYGNPQPYLGRFGTVEYPLLAVFGTQDEIARQHEETLREELIRSGKPHEVIVYPDAAHGFYNDASSAYNPEAADDAWRQALAFLETHQGKPPAPQGARSGTFQHGRVY